MITSDSTETVITIEVKMSSSRDVSFAQWQGELNATVASFPGFVSLEIVAPSPQLQNWHIIQRFESPAAAAAWSESPQYQVLQKSLQGLAETNHIKHNSLNMETLQNGVTEIFVSHVSPENTAAYQAWMSKIHLAEAKFPGFCGVYIQSPKHRQGETWLTLLRFDTMEHLDNWLASDIRREILQESSSLIKTLESHRVISPFAGWFSSVSTARRSPAVWKQTMLILLVLFPIVLLELKYLTPLLKDLSFVPATFISNALSVALITWPAMPLAIRGLRWWLLPDQDEARAQKTTLAGLVLVLLLYGLEIFMFSMFF